MAQPVRQGKEIALRSLHLNTEKGFRGGEVQTLALLKYLCRIKEEVSLLAPPGSPLLEKAAEASIPARPWKTRGELDLLAAWELRRMIREKKPRILHTHTAHALTLALLARGRSSAPLIVASRRVSFPLRTRLSLLKYGRADAVIAVSGSVARDLEAQGLAAERIRVIHSGVDLGRFADLPSRAEARAKWHFPNGDPVIGVVGALARHKGCGEFLTAFKHVWASFPGAQAIFAGSGSLLGSLRHAAERQNLPVQFLGFLPEPADLYPALDLLVLPSLSGEGSPGVIKEAAASGVPVVATDVGGTSEILRHGREALLVPPGDALALGVAILNLLRDSAAAERLRLAAKERIFEFSVEAMAESTLELYRELLARA